MGSTGGPGGMPLMHIWGREERVVLLSAAGSMAGAGSAPASLPHRVSDVVMLPAPLTNRD